MDADGGSGSKLLTRLKEKIEEQWRKTKEHAETYPYVWGSYILVYGGLAVYTTYRWRKLRKTEGRVRGLMERLQKLVEAEESAARTSSGSSSSSSENQHSHLRHRPVGIATNT